MNEEEKKAIEYLKQNRIVEIEYDNYGLEHIRRIGIDEKQIILNLIEKQKKEIKNMAEKTNELIDEYKEEILEKNNYIFQLENEREALHKLIDEEMG